MFVLWYIALDWVDLTNVIFIVQFCRASVLDYCMVWFKKLEKAAKPCIFGLLENKMQDTFPLRPIQFKI